MKNHSEKLQTYNLDRFLFILSNIYLVNKFLSTPLFHPSLDNPSFGLLSFPCFSISFFMNLLTNLIIKILALGSYTLPKSPVAMGGLVRFSLATLSKYFSCISGMVFSSLADPQETNMATFLKECKSQFIEFLISDNIDLNCYHNICSIFISQLIHFH